MQEWTAAWSGVVIAGLWCGGALSPPTPAPPMDATPPGRGVAAPQEPPRSTLIRRVRLVDGTGAPARPAAVRIVGDTIAAVGADLAPLAGEVVIDGHGLTLTPGFVDTHSHHDVGLAAKPEVRAAVSQGITTIVAGVDGSHPYPLAAVLDSLAALRPAVNVAFYAGHGALRARVMGADFRRGATESELEQMAALLRQELDAGALGLSTGLEYEPGSYADYPELLALARVAAAAGTRYLTHMRSEEEGFWSALDEAIAIGREARLPVQISHLKLAMLGLWGQADSVLRVLDRARASGVDVTADVYPYPFWQSTLTVLFPEHNYHDVGAAERILREVVPAANLRIGDFAPLPAYRGRTVAEIAGLRRESAAATLVGLVREAQRYADTTGTRQAVENGAGSAAVESVIATAMDDRDVATLLDWPHANLCSDGLQDGAHPRGYGAFPRFLGRHVREQRRLPFEAAVRKMTSLSAAHVGLRRRGTIAPGYYADLVLLDPEAVIDRSTPDAPHELAAGIAAVWVNGTIVWRDGVQPAVRPGRVVRRQAQ